MDLGNANFGFIISRHVNSELTNKYWNQSVKLIRTFYPYRQIIIIDDNSDYNFVNAQFPYQNLTIIQSEFPGRGELLPYHYYLKYKWFPNAVILHDSVFIHRRIQFEGFKVPVIPLWHHDYDSENIHNLNRIASGLTNNGQLMNALSDNNNSILSLRSFGNNDSKYKLCFGTQAFIKLNFLEGLENKYRISNLVNFIQNRTDRQGLERIMGLLFCIEYPGLSNQKSLFGDILTKNKCFSYNYDNYIEDLKKGKVIYRFVKVWSGR